MRPSAVELRDSWTALRAMLDWSYELFRDAEKALLAWVSVFSGGFTLDAAREVCIDEDHGDWEVLVAATRRHRRLTRSRRGLRKPRAMASG